MADPHQKLQFEIVNQLFLWWTFHFQVFFCQKVRFHHFFQNSWSDFFCCIIMLYPHISNLSSWLYQRIWVFLKVGGTPTSSSLFTIYIGINQPFWSPHGSWSLDSVMVDMPHPALRDSFSGFRLRWKCNGGRPSSGRHRRLHGRRNLGYWAPIIAGRSTYLFHLKLWLGAEGVYNCFVNDGSESLWSDILFVVGRGCDFIDSRDGVLDFREMWMSNVQPEKSFSGWWYWNQNGHLSQMAGCS